MKSIPIMIIAIALISGPLVAQQKPTVSPIRGASAHDITKDFGPRLHPVLKAIRPHRGVDFDVPVGTAVCVTADGIVLEAGNAGPYGLSIRIRHAGGYETFYAHLSKISVTKGQKLSGGATIAQSGNSGLSSAPHLHYEVLKNGQHVDPKAFIAAR